MFLTIDKKKAGSYFWNHIKIEFLKNHSWFVEINLHYTTLYAKAKRGGGYEYTLKCKFLSPKGVKQITFTAWRFTNVHLYNQSKHHY